MIITCPECATRYDLEEERFLPNGRSVRCTACGESWFVPAPEPIEALSRRATEQRREPAPRPTERHEPRHDDDCYDERGMGRDYRDARPRPMEERDRDDALRAERGDSDVSFSFDDTGFDADGHPEEAVVSIVQPEKDLLPPRDEKGRFMPRASGEGADIDANTGDYDDDDTLFDTPVSEKPRKSEPELAARDHADDAPPKGWRKGKQFYVEDKDAEPEDDPRPFFAKHFSKSRTADDDAREIRRDHDDRADRERVRFSEREEARHRDPYHDPRDHDGFREPVRDEINEFEASYKDYKDDEFRRAYRENADRESHREHDYDREFKRDEGRDRERPEPRAYEREDYEREEITPGQATVLDADWEDVDNGTGPRFGRRIREERRRATALARLEDVRRFEPEALDEEFFRSLRVTPFELEKAVRKARRRAEARDKNRMTPWRAFGWSAWVAAVAGAAYAVVAYRDEIVKVAPTTADAYAVVGIETDPTGLKIEDVRHRLAMSTGGPMIEITGALRNRGANALDAPLLQAEALGPRGELLARWTFRPEEPTVSGEGVVAFTTRNAAPDGVTEVALTFAPTQSSIAPQ